MALELDIDATVESLAADLFPAEPPVAGADASEGDDPDQREDVTEQEELPPGTEKGKTADTEDAVVLLETPKSWPKELAPEFVKLPKNIQEFWSKREADYAAGIGQYKQNADYGKAMHEVLSPYQAMLTAERVDGPTAVKTLLNAHYLLRTSEPTARKELFLKLAKDYQVDLGLPAGEEAAAKDPAILALERELGGVKHLLNSRQQAEHEAKQVELSKTVDEFANDPAHPYFDECGDDIAKFITAGYTLADAYEKAVWANPATRAKEQVRLSKETTAASAKKAEEVAIAARKRSKSNVKEVQTDRKTPTALAGSMDDTLRTAYRAINERTS